MHWKADDKTRKATGLGEKLGFLLAKMEIFPVKKLCSGYDFHVGKWKYRRGSSRANSTPTFGRIPLLACSQAYVRRTKLDARWSQFASLCYSIEHSKQNKLRQTQQSKFGETSYELFLFIGTDFCAYPVF